MKKEKETTPENPFEAFDFLNNSPQLNADLIKDESDIKTGDENIITEEEPVSPEEELEVEAAIAAAQAKEKDKEAEDDQVGEQDTQEEPEEEASFKPFLKHLADKQIIEDFNEEDFDDSEEGLEAAIDKTVKAKLEREKQSLPEDAQKFLEFVRAGGDPKQFLDVYYGETSFETIDIEKEENQRYVIKQGLKLAGWEDGEIDEELSDIEELGKLEAKAKQHLTKLQKAEAEQKEFLVKAQAKMAQEQAKANADYWNNLKENLFKKEEINGFTLTPKLKEKIWEHMSKPVDKKTGKTQLQINNETKTDAQFLYAYLDMNNFDISKLEKKATTKVTSDLRKKLGNFSDTRNKIKTGKSEIQKEEENPFAGFNKVKV